MGADAGRPDVDPERLAVVIGTGVGGVLSLLEQDDILEVSGPRKVSPHTVPMLMANGPAAWVSIDLGARGGAHTPVSACASGAEAIALGLDLIRLGRADVVVAGGTEACVHGLPLAGFAQMMALATTNNEPESASRPFGSERNGFVLGEGAAVLVLERRDFARSRGARAHGTLVGAGITSSAQHITASDTAGQVRTIRMALEAGGLAPEDIGLVHARATSTPQGDLAEANAVEEAAGTHPVVTATKSMTGHLQRELIVANTNDGLASARARGRVGGRRPKLTPDQDGPPPAEEECRGEVLKAISGLHAPWCPSWDYRAKILSLFKINLTDTGGSVGPHRRGAPCVHGN